MVYRERRNVLPAGVRLLVHDIQQPFAGVLFARQPNAPFDR